MEKVREFVHNIDSSFSNLFVFAHNRRFDQIRRILFFSRARLRFLITPVRPAESHPAVAEPQEIASIVPRYVVSALLSGPTYTSYMCSRAPSTRWWYIPAIACPTVCYRQPSIPRFRFSNKPASVTDVHNFCCWFIKTSAFISFYIWKKFFLPINITVLQILLIIARQYIITRKARAVWAMSKSNINC